MHKFVRARRKGEKPGDRMVEGMPARDIPDSEAAEHGWEAKLEASRSWSKTAGGKSKGDDE